MQSAELNAESTVGSLLIMTTRQVSLEDCFVRIAILEWVNSMMILTSYKELWTTCGTAVSSMIRICAFQRPHTTSDAHNNVMLREHAVVRNNQQSNHHTE